MARGIEVEIAVQDLAGVRTALEAGADRVELCLALDVGGLTPSAALIEGAAALAASAGRDDFVHVLVRTRPGDFVYTAEEVALLCREIGHAIGLGASGVVVGALRAEADAGFVVDRAALDAFAEAAGGASVTFHRAFDLIAERGSAMAVETAAELVAQGVRRVLTSGGAPRVGAGLETLGALAAAGTGLEIMAGGGAGVADVAGLSARGADAVHLSARRLVEGAPAGPGGGSAAYSVTDAETVRAAVDAARASA